jgi:hypothetical protein
VPTFLSGLTAEIEMCVGTPQFSSLRLSQIIAVIKF